MLESKTRRRNGAKSPEGIDAMTAMPVIFVGHGNPMNVLRSNSWTRGWVALGKSIPRPNAILSISAHWYIEGTRVTAMPRPRTIHDFRGFPRELFEIEYPAPGDLDLASRVQTLLSEAGAGGDQEWGLDHGTWSVLYHMFPDADVPVVQLSIDRRKPPSFHYEIGRMLRPLREEGILILGSGNVVHSLRAYNWEQPDAPAYDWALRFEEKVRESVSSGDDNHLVDYERLGPEASLSVPTPDHYLPLLFVLGSRKEGDAAGFPVEGFDGGSMSMLSVLLS